MKLGRDKRPRYVANILCDDHCEDSDSNIFYAIGPEGLPTIGEI